MNTTIGEVNITLDNGDIITSIGEHLWADTGIPGLSQCECGIYRKYDRQQKNYKYSERENN